jgi:hypothetical protein
MYVRWNLMSMTKIISIIQQIRLQVLMTQSLGNQSQQFGSEIQPSRDLFRLHRYRIINLRWWRHNRCPKCWGSPPDWCGWLPMMILSHEVACYRHSVSPASRYENWPTEIFLQLITVQILDVASALVHPTHCSSVTKGQLLSFSFLLLCFLDASILLHVPKQFN